MSRILGWGILGTGNIARQFCAGVNDCRRGRLRAVGSRSEPAARDFAEAFHIPTAAGGYERLLADRDVEAVYISLPNSMHHEWTLKALRAGKHVLCEKPLASNAAQGQEMFDAARQAGLVLIEAFMYRTHPQTHAVVQAVRNGAVGQVKLLRTSFCYNSTRIAGNIRFDPALAGGALMDIGCYCLDFSCLLAGEAPVKVYATARKHPTGVDELAAGTLEFPNGILASFTCGMTLQADNTAYICGDEGYIEVPVPWKPPRLHAAYTIAHGAPPRMDRPGQSAPPSPPRQTHHVDAGMDLYAIEADAFAAAVLDGATPFKTPDESLTTMRILDDIRRQVGIPLATGNL
jgi:predicted dehydrogenase